MLNARLRAMYARWNQILPTLATKGDLQSALARVKFWIACTALGIVLFASAWLRYVTDEIGPAPTAPPAVQQPQIIIIVYPVPAGQPVPPPSRL